MYRNYIRLKERNTVMNSLWAILALWESIQPLLWLSTKLYFVQFSWPLNKDKVCFVSNSWSTPVHSSTAGPSSGNLKFRFHLRTEEKHQRQGKIELTICNWRLSKARPVKGCKTKTFTKFILSTCKVYWKSFAKRGTLWNWFYSTNNNFNK